MPKLLVALAGLALLAACDPTQKHDFSCDGPEFGSSSVTAPACVQFHVTDAEGAVGQGVCADKGGTWHEASCPTANQVPGYCNVESASAYSLSGTPARVYFYTSGAPPVDETAAAAACAAGGGSWIPAT